MKSKVSFVLLAIALFGGSAAATLITYDSQTVDIEGTVGTGTSQTMIVIDWESGITASHAWLYNWNTSAVVADALDAIKTAYASFDWSQSAFVQYINYDDGSENHQTVNTGWLSFWNKDTGSWATNANGVYEQNLTNGGWSGAIADDYPDWGDVPPTVPTPEPATLMLVGLGALAVRRKK